MSERKPSVNRVLRAYSWDASLIGIEAKEPIEYPPEDKRIFAPMEDGVQQGNFSGQIFRELYERQAKGELGAEPILRERPPRDGTGDNFTLDNEKKYKIASRRVAAIKRVAARFLEAARTVDVKITIVHSEFHSSVGGEDHKAVFTVHDMETVRDAVERADSMIRKQSEWQHGAGRSDRRVFYPNKDWKAIRGGFECAWGTESHHAVGPGIDSVHLSNDWTVKLEFSSNGKPFPRDVNKLVEKLLQTGAGRNDHAYHAYPPLHRHNRDASRRIEIRRPSGPQGSDTVKVRGKTVRVGDWIGFKSDIEQEAEVIGIRGDQITVKAPPEGFQGDYIRRYREYTLSADRAW